MFKRSRWAGITAACLGVALGLTGCSSTAQPHDGTQADGPRPTGYQGRPITLAAEPGDAPATTDKPVGTVTTLPSGSKPWGVAADQETGSVVVALRKPGRLAVYDMRTGRLRVQPGPTARMIDLVGAGGPLMVPAESENTLYTLQVPSLRRISETPAGKNPHQAVRVGDTTFVTDEKGHAVRVLRDGRTVRTLREPVQPGGITAVGDRVAAVDVATNTLFVYDARDGKLVAALPAGKGPSHVVPIGGDRVAVCDVRGNAVLTYDIGGTPRTLGRTGVPGRAFWIEGDPASGTAYAALSNTNRVAVLRIAPDGTPHLSKTVPTVRRPVSMDLDRASGALYVAGNHDAQLQAIPPTALKR